MGYRYLNPVNLVSLYLIIFFCWIILLINFAFICCIAHVLCVCVYIYIICVFIYILCVCVYIYMYTRTHTHIHFLTLFWLHSRRNSIQPFVMESEGGQCQIVFFNFLKWKLILWFFIFSDYMSTNIRMIQFWLIQLTLMINILRFSFFWPYLQLLSETPN